MSNTVVIRSAMNPDLVLGASNGNVVLEWIDLSNKNQQWTREDHGQNFLLTNVGTGTGMAVSGNGIVVSGTGVFWNVGGQDTYQAIRLATDFNQNVNSPGSSMTIGTQLITYSWSGGAPNEIWWIENYSDIQPFATRTVQLFGGGGSRTALMFNAPDSQYYVEPQGIPSIHPEYRFTLTNWSQGISLQNQGSGQYMIYCGNDAWVCQSAGMCVNALWTLGAVSPNGYGAIRPWLDSDMNLNVFGSDEPQPGSHVGVYSWSGGKDNEVWTIMNEPAAGTAPRMHPAHKEAAKA